MQLDLFSKRLARRNDPVESQKAAVDVGETLSQREEEALLTVRLYPGHTASELDEHFCNRGRVIGKRLCELERKGLVHRCKSRRCRITGTTAATWKIV